MEMISLEFIYRSTTYYALIRTKIVQQEKQYHITIMNGELERLLYGHHIISPGGKDHLKVIKDNLPTPEIMELKGCIIDALWKHLGLNGMVVEEENTAMNYV
jgi:hypothetical protein